MKRYTPLKLQEYKFLFSEGRNEAIQYLKKKHPTWMDEFIVNTVNELEELDKKNGNKYILLYTMIFDDFLFFSTSDKQELKFYGEPDSPLLNYYKGKIVNGMWYGYKDISSNNSIVSYMNNLINYLFIIKKKHISIDIYKMYKDLSNKYKGNNIIYDFFSQIKKLATKPSKSELKKLVKQGLSGMTEGKDYIELPSDIPMYIPLTYQASKTLACERFGGKEGKWCTAYQKTDEYWEDYIMDRQGILVYILNLESEIEEYKKIAVYFYSGGNPIEIFDSNDKPINPSDFEKEIGVSVQNIKKLYNEKKIRNLILKSSDIDINTIIGKIKSLDRKAVSNWGNDIIEEACNKFDIEADDITEVRDLDEGLLIYTGRMYLQIFTRYGLSQEIDVSVDNMLDSEIDYYTNEADEDVMMNVIDKNKIELYLIRYLENMYKNDRDNFINFINHYHKLKNDSCEYCKGTGKDPSRQLNLNGNIADCPICGGTGDYTWNPTYSNDLKTELKLIITDIENNDIYDIYFAKKYLDWKRKDFAKFIDEDIVYDITKNMIKENPVEWISGAVELSSGTIAVYY